MKTVTRTRSSNKNIFTNMLVTRQVSLPMANVGGSIKDKLEDVLANSVEGKCVLEGYVKSGSTKIQSYSSGIVKGSRIYFEIVYECQVCNPVEGMLIQCVARNITKAGIRATTNDKPSPIVVFVARDHHTNVPYFSSVEPEQQIEVKVIGQRFELNDEYVSIIAELVVPNTNPKSTKKHKEKLIIEKSIKDEA